MVQDRRPHVSEEFDQSFPYCFGQERRHRVSYLGISWAFVDAPITTSCVFPPKLEPVGE
jgi:hypothetical protein